MAKILISDDSTFMRKMLIDILSKGGYKDFLEAKDGNEAIKMLDSEDVDLILLDIIMPDLDGIGVLEELQKRKDAGKSAPKVVVVSAVGQEEMVDKAKKMGVKAYIVKPFEEEEVIKAVKTELGETAESPSTAAPDGSAS